MPRIPTLTAEPRGGTPEISPSWFHPPGERGTREIGKGIEEFAQAAAKEIGRVENFREGSELIKLGSQFDGEMKAAHARLQNDPAVIADPTTYMARAYEEMLAARDRVLDQASTTHVKQALTNHINRQSPLIMAESTAQAIALGKANARGDFETQLEELSIKGGSIDPVDRANAIAQAKYLIGEARKAGLHTPEELAKREFKFEQDRLAKAMTTLATTNTTEMLRQLREGEFKNLDPNTQARIMEVATKRDKGLE